LARRIGGSASRLQAKVGALSGVLGVAYNRVILGVLEVAGRLEKWPVELRAASIESAVALLAWFSRGIVGGGEGITQSTLSGTYALGLLPVFFLVRFGLGAVSYAARTPGGLFAPMLVLGAQNRPPTPEQIEWNKRFEEEKQAKREAFEK
jgi:chloride channel protein, CIC family